jgi:hypothetical protein
MRITGVPYNTWTWSVVDAAATSSGMDPSNRNTQNVKLMYDQAEPLLLEGENNRRSTRLKLAKRVISYSSSRRKHASRASFPGWESYRLGFPNPLSHATCNSCLHCTAKIRLQSASLRWITLSVLIFGEPGFFSIIELTIISTYFCYPIRSHTIHIGAPYYLQSRIQINAQSGERTILCYP